MRLGNPLRGEPPLVPSEYETAGTRRASAEELWESFKVAIRERRFEDAAKLYSEFLRQPEVNAWLWYGNFTLGPFKAYPRTSIPALLRFPAFRDFYSDILADIARPPKYPARGVPGVSVPSARGMLGGKKTILYSSSDYEPVTHAGTLWFDTLVVPEIRRLGYTRRNIRDPLDHKPLFHQFLGEADLVTGCGHGGECYSEDTELLTENGWKHFYELEDGEEVATLNPETGSLEYQMPTHYFEYTYNGKMFHQKGLGVDLLVTPNHNLWGAPLNHGFKPYMFLKPTEVRNWECLKYKRGAMWDGGSPERLNVLGTEVKADDWVRFLGLYMAEGSAFIHYDGVGNHYQIVISQEDEESRKRIKPIVEKIADSFGSKVREDPDGLRFKNKSLCYYLKGLGHASTKSIPRDVKMLDCSLLKRLFEAYTMGDGHFSETRWEFSTSSKRLADDLQEIAMKIGLAATITSQYDRRYNSQLYYLTIPTERVDKCPTQGEREWVDYEGKVYDVEVPNHLLYVRRNGKPCWSGNSVYTGGLQEPLLECGKYDPQAVKGGGAKLLSCLLGSQLLPELAQHGMWSQGYVKTYSFQWDPKYGLTKPENDPVIRLFFLPFMRATIGLLNGMTNREAHDLEYSEYMTNAERTSDPEIRDLLIREANIFEVFGNPNARL